MDYNPQSFNFFLLTIVLQIIDDCFLLGDPSLGKSFTMQLD